jgi:hypothetical protein
VKQLYRITRSRQIKVISTSNLMLANSEDKVTDVIDLYALFRPEDLAHFIVVLVLYRT